MSVPSDSPGPHGRYRFRRGRALDPQEELHPEMAEAGPEVDAAIPNSPEALMAMQEHREERPEKPECRTPARARQVLDLINKLDTSPLEDQLIALSLVRKLEAYHDRIVEELQDDDSARHAQIAAWAIDADRLFQSRRLLESVDLE